MPTESSHPDRLYAEPRVVTDLEECTFYHTMDLPGHGLVSGEWDLREDVDPYLGGVELAGKRVLEVGTASGFLCFEMERRGAEVVAFDLSDEFVGDIVPFATQRMEALAEAGRRGTRRLNNAYWFAYRATGSKARVVHGTAYDIPEGIGPVDVVTYGCVLEHLRDPFLALSQGCRLARETVVVTCVVSRRHMPLAWLGPLGIAGQGFLPAAGATDRPVSWWILTPEFVRRAIGVLGFERTRTTRHSAIYLGRRARLFTVVGTRTRGGFTEPP